MALSLQITSKSERKGTVMLLRAITLHQFPRCFTAAVLAVLLILQVPSQAGLGCRSTLPATAAAHPEDYESMTEAQLIAEHNRLHREISRHEAEFFGEYSRIYAERNNRFVSNKVDVILEVLDVKAQVQVKQDAIMQIHSDVEREQRPAFLSEAERIRNLNIEISRLEELIKSSPDFEASTNREWFVEPDDALDQLKRDFDAQKTQSLDEALNQETNRSLADEVTRSLDNISQTHTPEVSRVCVDQGKTTYNSQGAEIQKRISRGRFLRDIWNNGMKLLEEQRAPWHSRAVTNLFMAVAVWDIAWKCVEEGFAAAAWDAAKFATISVFLGWLTKKGGAYLIAAETAGLGITMLALWDIWERAGEFAAGLIDSANRDLLLGNLAWPVRDPSTNAETLVPLGFRSFASSPAYGQPEDRWHLKFKSRAELVNAINSYLDQLGSYYGDPNKVPPRFNHRENMRLYLDVIGGEWNRRYKEEYEKLQLAFQTLRDAQVQKEPSLKYDFVAGKRPEPKGLILGAAIEPEIPKKQDRQVKIKVYYGLVAIPGASLRCTARSQFTKDGPSAGYSPEETQDDIDFGIGEAYKIFRSEKTYSLSGPGEYLFTFTVRLEPLGQDPPPRKIRIWIPGDQITQSTLKGTLYLGCTPYNVQDSMNHGLYVVYPADGQWRLVIPRAVNGVAISPDGTKLAAGILSQTGTGPGESLLAIHDAKDPAFKSLKSVCRLTSRDRAPQQLTNPTWSKDGNTLIVSRVGDLHLYDYEKDKGSRQILQGWYSDWSPADNRLVVSGDGLRILDDARRGGFNVDPWNEEMNIIQTAREGAVKKLEGPPSDAKRPRWSPDGATIAFESKGAIWLIPSSGGTPKQLSPQGVKAAAPAWSPDGAYMAFARLEPDPDGGIWAIKTDGTELRQVVKTNLSHIFYIDLAWGR